MAGPQTPGPGPGTWLFGYWVCQRLWLSHHHLQGTHGKGYSWTGRQNSHGGGEGGGGEGEALAACLPGSPRREKSS